MRGHSTSHCGAQRWNQSVTSGIAGDEQTGSTPATARMNAMTWLRVSADMNEPMARYPPAIKKLPM